MGKDNVTTKQGLSKMISSVYCVFKSEPVIMMKTIICGRFFGKKNMSRREEYGQIEIENPNRIGLK